MNPHILFHNSYNERALEVTCPYQYMTCVNLNMLSYCKRSALNVTFSVLYELHQISMAPFYCEIINFMHN